MACEVQIRFDWESGYGMMLFQLQGFTTSNGRINTNSEQIKIVKETATTHPNIFRTHRKIHVRIVGKHAETQIEYLPDTSPEQ
jgi:hypothetical protein